MVVSSHHTEYIIKKVQENIEGLELYVTCQLLVHDNIILGKNINAIKKNKDTLLEVSKEGWSIRKHRKH